MFQQTSNASDTARLEDYIRAVRLRKWLVLACAIVGLLGAYSFATSRTLEYTASSSVVLGPTPVGSLIDNRLIEPNLEREREIILSARTATSVSELIGFDGEPESLLSGLTVAFRPDSDVITVSATSTDPVQAASIANGFTEAFTETRDGASVAYYETALETSQEQLDAINTEIEALEASLAALTIERRNVLSTQDPGPDRDNTIATIDAESATARTEVNNLRISARGFETSIRTDSSALATRVPAAEVLRSASEPSTPDGLSSSLFAFGGLLAGLILGIITAFLLDRLDTTARDDEDVALALGTRVIGAVPTFGIGSRTGASALIMLSSGGSARIAASKEAFRRLRSSMQFLRSNDSIKTVIVTSATPAEGKSVITANLAISLAQSGARVALVSADLRRPTQEKLFGIQTSQEGLSGYLGQGSELTVEQIESVPNLFLVEAGPAPANPGELLGSARFRALLEEVQAEVDFTVIDTPPILSTADALAAAPAVDGVIVVVDSRRTETTELLQVRADLERSGARILGAVMNRRRFKRATLFNRRKYSYYKSERSNAAAPEIVAEQAA